MFFHGGMCLFEMFSYKLIASEKVRHENNYSSCYYGMKEKVKERKGKSMCKLTQEAVRSNPAMVLYNTVADFPSNKWFNSEAVMTKLNKRGINSISLDFVDRTLDSLVREGLVNQEYGLYRNIA